MSNEPAQRIAQAWQAVCEQLMTGFRAAGIDYAQCPHCQKFASNLHHIFHEDDCPIGIISDALKQAVAADSVPTVDEQCEAFQPSALGVPLPEDRCVKAKGHDGKHSRKAVANPGAGWSRDEITLEQADSLYRFLQGKTIDGITCSAMPNLSSQQAFSVIYVLQEHLHLIPDHYEMCDKCGDLLDDYREGRYDEKTGQHYCEGCL